MNFLSVFITQGINLSRGVNFIKLAKIMKNNDLYSHYLITHGIDQFSNKLAST